MWTSEVSIDISAPATEVYRYLADFPRHREWSSAVMAGLEQLTAGPIAVGAEFRAAETVPARLHTYSRITALEPNTRIAWHSWFSRFMAVDWEFELSERDGITQLVQRSAWQPGFGMGLFHRLVRRPRIPAENKSSLERIKAILENEVAISKQSGKTTFNSAQYV